MASNDRVSIISRVDLSVFNDEAHNNRLRVEAIC